MLRRIWALTKKDWRMLMRNYYVAAILLVALLYIVATRFLIPAELSTNATVVLFDETGSQIVREFYESHAGGSEQLLIVESAEQFASAVEGYNRIGLRVVGGNVPEQFEATFQGYENHRTRNLLTATLQAQAAALRGEGATYPRFETRVLKPGTAAERPPFNESLVPIWIYSEAALVGMLLGATLLFAEKDERALRAIRVTPATVVEYLAARTISMFLLGLLFTVVVTVFTIGVSVNWLAIIPMVLLGSAVITLAMMVLANMFDSLGQFIFPGIILMVLLGFPTVIYFVPSFSPPLMRLLPTYPLIFGLREAYFPTGSAGILSQALIQLAITVAVVFPLAALTFRRQLIARDV